MFEQTLFWLIQGISHGLNESEQLDHKNSGLLSIIFNSVLIIYVHLTSEICHRDEI